MKSQKLSRKLILNKETISDLSKNEMDSVNGGTGLSWSCSQYLSNCQQLTCDGGAVCIT